MKPEQGVFRERSLLERERLMVRSLLSEQLLIRQAGQLDRKYFPVNEQIREERITLGWADYDLEKQLKELKKSHYGLGVILQFGEMTRVKIKRDLISVRKRELERSWYTEDETQRRESGAKWEDLSNIFESLDIPIPKTQVLVRPHYRTIPTRQENPDSGLADSYSFVSDTTEEVTFGWGDNRRSIERPAHMIEVFGNEVTFNEKDFDALVKRLELNKLLTLHKVSSSIGSIASLHSFGLRLGVPYRNWQLVSDKTFYDFQAENGVLPAVAEDANKEYNYWDDSLLPQILIPGYVSPENAK